MRAMPGHVLIGTDLNARLHENAIQLHTTPTNTVADYQQAITIMPVVLGIGLLLCLFLNETYPSSTSNQ